MFASPRNYGLYFGIAAKICKTDSAKLPTRPAVKLHWFWFWIFGPNRTLNESSWDWLDSFSRSVSDKPGFQKEAYQSSNFGFSLILAGCEQKCIFCVFPSTPFWFASLKQARISNLKTGNLQSWFMGPLELAWFRPTQRSNFFKGTSILFNPEMTSWIIKIRLLNEI